MGCKVKRCNVCWIRRQLIMVAAATLGVYWGASDSVTEQVSILFALAAVIFLLVIHHED